MSAKPRVIGLAQGIRFRADRTLLCKQSRGKDCCPQEWTRLATSYSTSRTTRAAGMPPSSRARSRLGEIGWSRVPRCSAPPTQAAHGLRTWREHRGGGFCGRTSASRWLCRTTGRMYEGGVAAATVPLSAASIDDPQSRALRRGARLAGTHGTEERWAAGSASVARAHRVITGRRREPRRCSWVGANGVDGTMMDPPALRIE
jgi:hypothetical protein